MSRRHRSSNRPSRQSNTLNSRLIRTLTYLDYTVLEPRQLLVANLLSTAPDGQWLGLSHNALQSQSGDRLLNLRNFGLYDLQEQTIGSVLRNAPLEFTPGFADRAVTISIPRPDQTFARFAVVESPIMEPGLAAQFPDIKTYRGIGLDDPGATIRFDTTMHGFHAQVLSPSGRYYVDPFFKGQTGLYASYFKSDLIASDGHQPEHEDDLFPLRGPQSNGPVGPTDPPVVGDPPQPAAPFGDVLRTFRLANAATAEYTAFWGGTVAAGQSAIVTAVNRVTGVYEKDLAIRLVLVANNSSLVFTNSATDGYTNNNGVTMLGENQTKIDTVILNANYDIGHVFSTGGGGVAGLGVVGIAGNKARGVTGGPSPNGDAFWIDYVAHEMGHQFGGNHSFNSVTGNCGGGNRSAGSAYEPGSASSIMGYAGICGADDLQPNSDAMMHSVSIDSVRAFITGTIPGVGVNSGTGNSIPTVNAGLDYKIPTGTPFELTAVGSDANVGNVLTYSWEQRNLGAAATLAAGDNGASPLFRTWNPTTNPTRVFPRLSNLLANTVPIGEKLPTVAWAAMNFRSVVRDNSAGGGGVASDDMSIQVINTGSFFSVTSQNSATSWIGNSAQTISWNVAGTDANGINTANVDIYLSTDGGLTYPTLLATATPNDGSQAITVPNINSSTARIKVKGSGNIFFDINNTNIVITPGVVPTVNLSGPAGLITEGDTGSSSVNFVLTLSAAPTSTVTVNYATSSVGFANPATGGVDYSAVSGTATFLAGQTVVNIPTNIFGDRFTEGVEQFGMSLSSPVGLNLGTSSVTASIGDDDAFALGRPIDLGTATSPVQVGATGFSTNAYNAFTGMGWTASSDLLAYQMTIGDDLTRDLLLATSGNFQIDLPNGAYNVQLIFGIVDFSVARANYPATLANFNVLVESVTYPLTLELGTNVSRSYSTTVADSKLDIGLLSDTIRRGARLSGIVVTAALGRSAGDAEDNGIRNSIVIDPRVSPRLESSTGKNAASVLATNRLPGFLTGTPTDSKFVYQPRNVSSANHRDDRFVRITTPESSAVQSNRSLNSVRSTQTMQDRVFSDFGFENSVLGASKSNGRAQLDHRTTDTAIATWFESADAALNQF